jgi:hypothetical protein
MNRPLFQAEDEGAKRGVALIIVLGFLSIMILMAVAFLTQARTERLVADATLEAQRGRQLVRTAISAAMNDYSVDLIDQKLLLPPENMQVFPSIAPTAASGMGGRKLSDDGIRLMVGEASYWLPRRYLTSVVTNQVGSAQWILVRDGTSQTNRILGRYAYACFDMSGGIDANLIALTSGVAMDGNATNRASVRDVGMGELAETADASDFKRLRSGWHGFDNLMEVILLTNGRINDGTGTQDEFDDTLTSWTQPSPPRWRGDRLESYGAALTASLVTDLVPYSLAAYRGVYDFAAAKWRVPQPCNANTDWAQVLEPVAGQLLNPTDAVKALQDYFSSSPAPQGVDYPSVKSVPMFNELGTSFKLDFKPASTQLVLTVELAFETWYPFPSEINDDIPACKIVAPTIGGGFATSGSEDVWMRCALRSGAHVKLEKGSAPVPALLNFSADFNAGKPKLAGTFKYEMDVVPEDTNVVVTAADVLLIRGIKVQKPIKMQMNTTDVDQMVLEIKRSLTLAAGAAATVFSQEVDDPRLNHLSAHWSEADVPTVGEVNGAATLKEYGKPGGEGLYMFCRNGPMLTPAELGFIPTGNAWETIDLCESEGVTMLSKLVTDPTVQAAVDDLDGDGFSDGTFYTNGTINPNTSSPNVLRSAFAGLSTREVPEMPSTFELDPLSADDANDLALSMIEEAKTKKIQAGVGAFISPADWARSPAMQRNGSLSGKGLNKNQREALIRNTWGLFSPDNSLFTVLVIGQAIKEGPGQAGSWDANTDVITGERRAVALVWRDPFPGKDGHHHEMFIRMFKFLDE